MTTIQPFSPAAAVYNAGGISQFGFKVLADGQPESPTTDIVVIHGLDGHRELSFTADNGVLWFRDLLPAVIPSARIITYGYDANTRGEMISQQTLNDLSEDFIGKLSTFRETTGAKERPIIFVAYEFGGIMLKNALIHANAAHDRHLPNRKAIAVATCGILFVGTPHQGIDFTSRIDIDNRLLKHMGMYSELLQYQQTLFNAISHKYKTVYCHGIYNTSPDHPIVNHVPIHSAIVQGAVNAESFAIHKTQIELLRLKSAEDGDYQWLSSKLREMAEMEHVDEDSLISGIPLFNMHNIAVDRVISRIHHYVESKEWFKRPIAERPIACTVKLCMATDGTNGRWFLLKLYEGSDDNKRKREFLNDLSSRRKLRDPAVAQLVAISASRSRDDILGQMFFSPADNAEQGAKWLQNLNVNSIDLAFGFFDLAQSFTDLVSFCHEQRLKVFGWNLMDEGIIVMRHNHTSRPRWQYIYTGPLLSGSGMYDFDTDDALFASLPVYPDEQYSSQLLLKSIYDGRTWTGNQHDLQMTLGVEYGNLRPSDLWNRLVDSECLGLVFFDEVMIDFFNPGDVCYFDEGADLVGLIRTCNVHQEMEEYFGTLEVSYKSHFAFPEECCVKESILVRGLRTYRRQTIVTHLRRRQTIRYVWNADYSNLDIPEAIRFWRRYAPEFSKSQDSKEPHKMTMVIDWEWEWEGFIIPDDKLEVPDHGNDILEIVPTTFYLFEAIDSPIIQPNDPRKDLCISFDPEPVWIDDEDRWPDDLDSNSAYEEGTRSELGPSLSNSKHSHLRALYLPECVWKDRSI